MTEKKWFKYWVGFAFVCLYVMLHSVFDDAAPASAASFPAPSVTINVYNSDNMFVTSATDRSIDLNGQSDSLFNITVRTADQSVVALYRSSPESLTEIAPDSPGSNDFMNISLPAFSSTTLCVVVGSGPNKDVFAIDRFSSSKRLSKLRLTTSDPSSAKLQVWSSELYSSTGSPLSESKQILLENVLLLQTAPDTYHGQLTVKEENGSGGTYAYDLVQANVTVDTVSIDTSTEHFIDHSAWTGFNTTITVTGSTYDELYGHGLVMLDSTGIKYRIHYDTTDNGASFVNYIDPLVMPADGLFRTFIVSRFHEAYLRYQMFDVVKELGWIDNHSNLSFNENVDYSQLQEVGFNYGFYSSTAWPDTYPEVELRFGSSTEYASAFSLQMEGAYDDKEYDFTAPYYVSKVYTSTPWMFWLDPAGQDPVPLREAARGFEPYDISDIRRLLRQGTLDADTIRYFMKLIQPRDIREAFQIPM